LANARELGHLTGGHYNDISSDGTRALAWGGGPGLLWTLPTRRLIARIQGVSNATFAPDGRGGELAVFATGQGELLEIDSANGRVAARIDTGLGSISDVVAASAAPVVAASDGHDCVVAKLTPLRIVRNLTSCELPELSPHAALVASVGDGGLVLVDEATGATHDLNLGSGGIPTVAFPSDRAVVASDDLDGLAAYDRTGQVLLRQPNLADAKFAPDGRSMIATMSLGTSNLVGRFAYPSGTVEAALLTTQGPPEDVEVSGDGHVVAIVEAEFDRATLIDADTGQTLAVIHAGTQISDVSIDRTGSRLLTVNQIGGDTGSTPDVWNGAALPAVGEVPPGQTADAQDLAVNSTGTVAWVTKATGGCLIRLASAQRTCLRGYFQTPQVSPDGARLVGLYSSTPLTQDVPPTDAAIYAGDGRRVALIRPSTADSFIDSIVLDPTGRRAATAELGGPIRIWRLTDGHLLASFRPKNFYEDDLAWSRDGSELAAAGQGGMTLYDATRYRQLQTFAPPHTSDQAPEAYPGECEGTSLGAGCPALRVPVVLSRTRIAAEIDEYDFALFNARTGRLIAKIEPPGRTIDTVELAGSSDGSTFAISTNEGVVRSYSAASGAAVGDPIDLPDVINQDALPIALTGDGRVLMALDNGRLSVWQLSTGDLLATQAADAFGVARDGAGLTTLSASRVQTFLCSFCGDAALLLPAARLVTHPFTAAERATYLAGQSPRFSPR
jgi:hypothetical protein